MIDEHVMENLIQIPDEDEAMEELESRLSDEGFAITNFSKGGIFYNLLRVAVHIGIELKNLAVSMINSAFMLHCPEDWVDVRAADYGIQRKEGIKTEGYITIHRAYYDHTVQIKKGHPFRSRPDMNGNVLRFYAVEDTMLEAGEETCMVYVQAEEAGTAYNVSAGQIDQTLVYIDGCDYVENTDGWIVIEGTNEESTESLRSRCISSRAVGAVRTIDAKIKSVVDAVPGVVVSAIDSQHPRGQGTVDIIVTGAMGTAGETVLNAVREAIEPLTGSIGDYLVKSADAKEVDFNITLYFDKGTATGGYTEQAENVLRELMEITSRSELNKLYHADIITAIKVAIPVCRICKIAEPVTDVIDTKGTVLTAGNISVSADYLE